MVKFDKHIFLNSISNFEIPTNFSLEELNVLLNKYPAFNSLQLINAVLTNKENPNLFEKNLSKTATKVIDRAILHDYIFKNKFTFKELDLKKNNEIVEIIEEPNEVVKEPIIEELVIDTKQNVPTSEEKIITEIAKEKTEEEKEIQESIIDKELVEESTQEELTEETIEIPAIVNEKTEEEIVELETTTSEITESELQKIDLEDESIEKSTVADSPLTKTEGRDKAYQNLSNDLFKDRLENSDKPTSEKDKRRIEAMKKLQDELFNSPVKKKPTTKPKEINEPVTEAIEKTITPEPVFEEPKIEEVIKEEKKPLIDKKIESDKVTPPVSVNKEAEKDINEPKQVEIPEEKITEPDITEPQEELTPLEKIRLAKALKDKDNSKEKAKNLISKLKQEQFKTVDSQKATKDAVKEEKTIEFKKEETLKPIEKVIPKKNIEETTKVQNETHLQKIEQLKAKIRASKIAAEAKRKEAEKNKPKEKTTPLEINQEEKIIEPTKLKEEKVLTKIKKPIIEKKIIEELVKKEPNVVVEKNVTKEPLTMHDFLMNTKTKKIIKVPEKKTITHEVPHAKDSNFLQWLKHSLSEKPEVLEEPTKEILAKNVITEEKQPLEKIAKEKSITNKVVEEKIEEKEDLIPFDKVSAIEHEMHQEIKKSTDPLDDFISNQIARKKVVRTKITKKPNSNLGLISETLAEILVIQQKYTEAIEVYNTLSLKYPEKSIYFAHQIEKIKNY